jgi:hypothetical protein
MIGYCLVEFFQQPHVLIVSGKQILKIKPSRVAINSNKRRIELYNKFAIFVYIYREHDDKFYRYKQTNFFCSLIHTYINKQFW